MKVEPIAERNLSETGATAEREIEFTGERLVPGKTAEALFREHEERYVFAGQYVSGKDVLDVACGTGAGTSFLRQAGARSAWGLDIDQESISFAKARYRDCEFAQCEATRLCLADNSIDIVVSFETLEHLKYQRAFLEGCWRVLRPGGTFICSTPNIEIGRWSASNPFHHRELDPKEFQELVASVFTSVQLYGQRNQTYLLYVPRKTIRRILGWLGLNRAVERIMARRPTTETFRVGFVNDASTLSESISVYTRDFLIRPMFLIAVARKPPVQSDLDSSTQDI